MAVLGGWIFDYEPVKSLMPYFPTMKVNTSLGFILLGMGLFYRTHQNYTKGIACSLTLFGLSFLTSIEVITTLNLGIDQLFIKDTSNIPHPGQMSPATALSFLMMSLLLLGSLKWQKRYHVLFDMLYLTSLSIELMAFFSYLYNPYDLFTIPLFSTMALHTNLCFLIFLLGLALNSTEHGVLNLLSRRTQGGQQFRRLLPLILFLPLTWGWVLFNLVKLDWFPLSLGISFFAVTITLLIITVLAWNSMREDRITAEMEQDRLKLLDIQQKLAVVLDVAVDAVILFNNNGMILHANSGVEHIFGYTLEELCGKSLSDLVPPRFRKVHTTHVDTFKKSLDTTRLNNDPIRMVAYHKDGRERPVLITIAKRTIDHETFIVAMVKDATSITEQINQLARKLHRDPLTGINNRRALRETLEETIITDNSIICAVFMLDIDHFKAINDQWGHTVGDEVLIAFAHKIQKSLRVYDRFFRYGGEEFVILTTQTKAAKALEIGERICTKISQEPLISSPAPIHITCSIGISLTQRNETTLHAALERADQAVYEAKRQGRNRVILG